MDTISLDGAVKYVLITLQEIDSKSDIGPYDDDDDTKQSCPSVHGSDSLLNMRMSLQTYKRKSLGI